MQQLRLDPVLSSGPRRLGRQRVAVAGGLRRPGVGADEPVVVVDRLPVEVLTLDLRRAREHVLGHRRAHDPSGVVDMREDLGENVPGAGEQPSLDDQVAVAAPDHLAELLVVEGDDLISLHRATPSFV